MDACQHGLVTNYDGVVARICAPCLSLDTGLPVSAVVMVLGAATKRIREYQAARAELIPPLTQEDVLAVHEHWKRRDRWTLADFGLVE